MSKIERLKHILLRITNDEVRESLFRIIRGLHAFYTNMANKYRLLIYRNKHGKGRVSTTNLNIYDSDSILNDAWINESSKDNGHDLYDERFFLHLSFISTILKLNDYNMAIEFGAHNGRLARSLANIHQNIEFRACDIAPDTEKLSETFAMDNLLFSRCNLINEDITTIAEGKTLFISKSSLCCLVADDLNRLFNKLSASDLDVVLMEPCSHILNESSRLMSVSKKHNGHVLFSHPYGKVLKQHGYLVAYNSQENNLSMLYQRYYPYYLTFIYARKVHLT